jgi:hypothetical protein
MTATQPRALPLWAWVAGLILATICLLVLGQLLG